jgi:hypothetical protein
VLLVGVLDVEVLDIEVFVLLEDVPVLLVEVLDALCV